MNLFFKSLQHLSLSVIVMAASMQYVNADQSKGAKAEEVVKKLYRDYAWQALSSELGESSIQSQPNNELEKYFEISTASLINKDGKCAEQIEDACQLDFDIIFDSQDPAAFEMKLAPINTRDEVLVQFKYPSNQELIKLTYKMKQTVRGWRIYDIFYERTRTSLRAILNKNQR